MGKQIFFSYSTDDSAVVTTIRDHLEGQGIACWIAPRDITPGKDYGEQIINAIEDATVFLLILSESSNHSTFVRHEVERAVSKGKAIIPFRLHPVQPSRGLEFFISNYQWIDGWEGLAAKSWDALVAAIQDHLTGKSTPSGVALAATTPVTPVAEHNLPHELTPFVGRAVELAALDGLLNQRDVRLITILGPGGMGKTRLALAAAERQLAERRLAHGLYFVALAPLSDAQYIVPTLAEALSFALQPGGEARTAQQQLLDYLRAKQMLLIFDNFEHLLDGAEVVAQILRAAPQVQVLATSRERLRLPGEHLFPIQGLDYHNGNRPAGEAGSAAVQLFTQSARLKLPELELSEAELAQVTTICRLVGGMPLGIELAASWMEVLSPAEIVAEIQRSLDFLEAEQRGGQQHHRSVRAVFDSTWQRLEPSEQTVFAALSIFRGGFTREAAEAVAGASLRLLSTLAGKSLIQHEHERGRYTIHELLRQFAGEKLKADLQRTDETYERLCLYYSAFLQQKGAPIKGRQHAAAMSEIEAEIENIRSAWQWALTHRSFELIDRSVEVLWVFYTAKARFQEGATVFGLAAGALQAEELTGKQEILLGRVLSKQGNLQKDLAFFEAGSRAGQSAQVLFQRSMEIFNKFGMRSESGLPLFGLASLAFRLGEIEQALQLGEEALIIFREEHDLSNMSLVLRELGHFYAWMGSYAQAILYCRQAVAAAYEGSDLRTLGLGLYFMGEALRASGDYEKAIQVADEGIKMSRAMGNKRGTGWSYKLLGHVAWHMGDFVTAQRHAETSLALFQESGWSLSRGAVLNLLGNIACSLGDYRKARSYFYTVLEAHLKSDTLYLPSWVTAAITGLATVLAKEGKTMQAVEVLDLVLRHPLTWQEHRDRAAKLLTGLAPEALDLAEKPARPLDVVIAELLSMSYSTGDTGTDGQ